MLKFWETFEKLRREKRYQYNEIAQLINVHPTTFSKWREGAIPAGDKVVKLAKLFNVSTDYLLTGEENNKLKFNELQEFINKNVDAGSGADEEGILQLVKETKQKKPSIFKVVKELLQLARQELSEEQEKEELKKIALTLVDSERDIILKWIADNLGK